MIAATALLIAQLASPFDQAGQAVVASDFAAATKLYARAAASEPEEWKRTEAEVRLANIEWRVYGKFDAAVARLRKLGGSMNAHLELARIAGKRGDWKAARGETDAAYAAAKTNRERRRAAVGIAETIVRGRHNDEMRNAITTLREVIAVEGPTLEAARLLARAGLLANDGHAALEGITGYYKVPAYGEASLIAPAQAVLARILPPWKGAPDDAIIGALAGIRFFEEAALVASRANPPSTLGRDVIDYAAALNTISDGLDVYYQRIAVGRAHDHELRRLLAFDARTEALAKRFGAHIKVADTGEGPDVRTSHMDVRMSHVIGDTTVQVQQYGHRGTFRFIALDGLVSNGYSWWSTDGRSGVGGWPNGNEIYQLRPPFANGPLKDWLLVSDAEIRAEDEKKRPQIAFRLVRQYLDGVLAELRARDLAGYDLRDAFVDRVASDHAHFAIEVHEGRHAIDARLPLRSPLWEREYRAKLAQIGLSRAPRAALAVVAVGTSGNGSAHDRANEKLLADYGKWMRANAAAVVGLDRQKPMTEQLDKLSDEQILAVARDLDPLAPRR